MSPEHALLWTVAFLLLCLVNLVGLVTYAILHKGQALQLHRNIGLETLLWTDLVFIAALSAFGQSGFRGSIVWLIIAFVWRGLAKGNPRASRIWRIVGWTWVAWNTAWGMFALFGTLAFQAG